MKKTTKTATAKAPVPYFSLSRNEEEKSAEIFIFGDIASERGGLGGLLRSKSDQSSYDLANQVANIPEDYVITVHINSNGGEVKEGLAIYNTLKNRNVTTICEGFAASAASVIFCAGKTRIMQPASLLFIHQASMIAQGNADDFRKASEDLDIITSAAMAAYLECGIVIDEDMLKKMMQEETWITPTDAVTFGFATEIAEVEETTEPTNSAMDSIMKAVTAQKKHEMVFEIGFEDGVKETITQLFESVNSYANILDVFNKAATALNEDPALMGHIKEFVTSLTATNPAPVPAKVDNKGFFNLK